LNAVDNYEMPTTVAEITGTGELSQAPAFLKERQKVEQSSAWPNWQENDIVGHSDIEVTMTISGIGSVEGLDVPGDEGGEREECGDRGERA
jgi:hypothetical protein